MTPEEQITHLVAVLCDTRHTVNEQAKLLSLRAKEIGEAADREYSQSEELNSYAAENKCLRTRIKRLERDLKLAQRMAGPKKVRK